MLIHHNVIARSESDAAIPHFIKDEIASLALAMTSFCKGIAGTEH